MGATSLHAARVVASCHHYPESEFSRDEERGRLADAAAAAAAGAAGLEPYPAAAVGPGLPAGALSCRLPLRFPRVSLRDG